LQSAAKIIAEIWSCVEHPEEAQLVRMSYFKNLDLRATEHQVTTAFVACMPCCELEGILKSVLIPQLGTFTSLTWRRHKLGKTCPTHSFETTLFAHGTVVDCI